MAQMYRQVLAKALNKEVNFLADDIRVTLHSSAYAPALDTHAYVSSLTSELATGGGYTSGGQSLASKTAVVTAANSWGTSRASSTAYAVDRVVRPATGNGFLYRCVIAGTSASTVTSLSTVVGQTTVDGTVTWENVGRAILVLDAADVAWAAASFVGVRYLVLSDRTPGTAATQPLVALVDFGTDQAGQGGTFTEQWSDQGIVHMFMP